MANLDKSQVLSLFDYYREVPGEGGVGPGLVYTIPLILNVGDIGDWLSFVSSSLSGPLSSHHGPDRVFGNQTVSVIMSQASIVWVCLRTLAFRSPT